MRDECTDFIGYIPITIVRSTGWLLAAAVASATSLRMPLVVLCIFTYQLIAPVRLRKTSTDGSSRHRLQSAVK